MSNPQDEFRLYYRLDKDNRVITVGGGWDDFALANDAPAAVGHRVVGRILDDFIVGDVTRMFVKTMLDSARFLNRPVYRPYRCDSASEKRFMEMLIEPVGHDRLLDVRHRVLRVESVRFRLPEMRGIEERASNLSTAARTRPAGSALHLKRCSLCNLLQVGQLWREAEDLYLAGTIHTHTPVNVFYGICPRCSQRQGQTL